MYLKQRHKQLFSKQKYSCIFYAVGQYINENGYCIIKCDLTKSVHTKSKLLYKVN